ncbi:MAG: hypothetical protein U9N02_09290 [Campylobacterota bacterium]|nr:hypothetical protein [Campylobacterota bacterium]
MLVKNKQAKNGVVLLVTLMLIMLLLGLVTLFLSKTKQSKDFVTYSHALNQTSLTMTNLVTFIKQIQLDEESIFYAAGMPYPINLGQSDVTVEIDSAQKTININSLISDSLKNNITSDKFIDLLIDNKIKEPIFFLNLLQDTIDKDDQSRNNSEIILEYPTFRNGKIHNSIHFKQIIDYYFSKTGDANIYDFKYEEIFNFTSNSIDMNFISMDAMELLFDDANHYILETISKHEEIYEKLDDLPFDSYYMKKVKAGKLGQSFMTETQLINMKISINHKGNFTSHISVLYNIKSKNILEYNVDKITIN